MSEQPRFADEVRLLVTRYRALALLSFIVFAVPLAIGQINFFGTPVALTASTIGFPGFIILLFFTALALVSWAFSQLRNPEGFTVRTSPAFISLGTFLLGATLLAALSRWTVASMFGSYSYHNGLLTWYALGIVCFLVVQEVRSVRRMRALLAALCASSALIVALSFQT